VLSASTRHAAHMGTNLSRGLRLLPKGLAGVRQSSVSALRRPARRAQEIRPTAKIVLYFCQVAAYDSFIPGDRHVAAHLVGGKMIVKNCKQCEQLFECGIGARKPITDKFCSQGCAEKFFSKLEHAAPPSGVKL